MASFSYSAARGQVFKVEDITIGTSAPGAGGVELRVDKAVSLNRQEIIDILGVFIRRLNDPRFDDPAGI